MKTALLFCFALLWDAICLWSFASHRLSLYKKYGRGWRGLRAIFREERKKR